MSRRQIVLLVSIVVLFHGGLLLFFAKSRSLPFKPSIPRPNFIAREARFVDEETGEKLVYREFLVSTKLSEEKRQAAPRLPAPRSSDTPPTPLVFPIQADKTSPLSPAPAFNPADPTR